MQKEKTLEPRFPVLSFLRKQESSVFFFKGKAKGKDAGSRITSGMTDKDKRKRKDTGFPITNVGNDS